MYTYTHTFLRRRSPFRISPCGDAGGHVCGTGRAHTPRSITQQSRASTREPEQQCAHTPESITELGASRSDAAWYCSGVAHAEFTNNPALYRSAWLRQVLLHICMCVFIYISTSIYRYI